MLLLGDVVELQFESEFWERTIIIGEITGLRSDQFNADNQMVLIGSIGHWFTIDKDTKVKKFN